MGGKIKCQEMVGTSQEHRREPTERRSRKRIQLRPPSALRSRRSRTVPALPALLSVCLDPPFGRGVLLRQGLWIADLQTPPGQECSNGSMLCVAVVL